MAFWQWSKTASADATADPTINYSEGEAPSSLNDSGRAVMARLAEFRDDISGLIATTGTSTAYAIVTNQGLATIPNDGQLIAFSPHMVNGIAVTLTADGGTTYPIQSSPGVPISAGSLVTGSPYTAKFSLSNLAWILFGFYANPFNIPLATGMDYWGTSIPNSNFAFPAGQAISRTTYATLFAIMGTTYGVGDGVTTFNLPDKTGRVSAMKEAIATRLTTAGSGVNGATMGSAGGNQSKTLAVAELPTITSNVSFGGNVAISGSTIGAVNSGTAGVGSPYPVAASGWSGISSATATSTGTNSTPFAIIPPLIICNYIIRII